MSGLLPSQLIIPFKHNPLMFRNLGVLSMHIKDHNSQFCEVQVDSGYGSDCQEAVRATYASTGTAVSTLSQNNFRSLTACILSESVI